GTELAWSYLEEAGLPRAAPAAVVLSSVPIAPPLADDGIRVNCIAPGHIATAITTYDMGAIIRTTQPLQRHGTPEDVANAFVFLASDRAAQITGIVVPVDGGTVAGPPAGQMRALLLGDHVQQDKAGQGGSDGH
ncbi:MAG: hypothetical protein AMXMBFR46_09200, partial [Acidimicrobiia bacterium]